MKHKLSERTNEHKRTHTHYYAIQGNNKIGIKRKKKDKQTKVQKRRGLN